MNINLTVLALFAMAALFLSKALYTLGQVWLGRRFVQTYRKAEIAARLHEWVEPHNWRD